MHTLHRVHDLKVFCGTIDKVGCIIESTVGVVVEQSVLPGGPCTGIHEFWDWTVEKGDGSARVVVVGHPLYSLE